MPSEPNIFDLYARQARRSEDASSKRRGEAYQAAANWLTEALQAHAVARQLATPAGEGSAQQPGQLTHQLTPEKCEHLRQVAKLGPSVVKQLLIELALSIPANISPQAHQPLLFQLPPPLRETLQEARRFLSWRILKELLL